MRTHREQQAAFVAALKRAGKGFEILALDRRAGYAEIGKAIGSFVELLEEEATRRDQLEAEGKPGE